MDFQKYNIKEKKSKKNKVTRIIKKTTTTTKKVFALKIGFFFKVIVGYKN